jgi:hypothetical protein
MLQGYGADIAAEYFKASVGEDAFCVGEYWTDMDWRSEGLAYGVRPASRQCSPCNASAAEVRGVLPHQRRPAPSSSALASATQDDIQ